MLRFKLSSVLLALMLSIVLSGCSKTAGDTIETVENGQTFTMDQMSFTPEEEGSAATIAPDSRVQYYNYYPEYDGYEYYFVKGTLKNEEDQKKEISSYYVESETSGKRADAKLIVTNEDKSDFVKGIEAHAEVDFFLITFVEKGGDKPDSFRIFSGSKGDDTWENEIQYRTESE